MADSKKNKNTNLYYTNRELSWLRYDDRVLDEALDLSVPVFERLNFISIFVSNLEEFFQVRVGSLIGDVNEGDDDVDVRSGMTARDQLRAIHDMVPKLLEKKDLIYRIVDIQLGQAGLKHVLPQQLTKTETARTGSFFHQKINGGKHMVQSSGVTIRFSHRSDIYRCLHCQRRKEEASLPRPDPPCGQGDSPDRLSLRRGRSD